MIARRTVTHIASIDTDTLDLHGNPFHRWDEPEVRKVFGWYQSSSSESSEQGANRVATTLVVLSPWPAAVKDQIAIDGVTYEVVGESQDWNHGPFAFEPGYQFSVRRIDG